MVVRFVKRSYYKRPSSFKLVQLFSAENVKDICNLCKYLYHASKIYSALLSSIYLYATHQMYGNYFVHVYV
jgi:hypothetical protein